MNARHRRFELLCVQASCGQLSERRLETLRQHAADCHLCRKHLQELDELNLRLWTAMPSQTIKPATRNMTERFVLRAIREGVPMSHKPGYRAVRFALALPTIIVLTMMTALVAWHGSGTRSHEIVTNSATSVSMDQGSGASARSPAGNEARMPRNHAAARRIIPPNPSSSEKLTHELPGNSRGYVSVLFTNGLQLGSLRSGQIASSSKFSSPNQIAPALAAWLARQSSPPAWASVSHRSNCDPRDESFPGDQPWSAWERDNVSGPPVFCFDPQIALVADSKLPRWNRPLESPPPFFVSAATPGVIH